MIGTAMTDATSQTIRNRRRWFGPPAGSSAGGGASLGGALDDIEVAVHVAEGLHRAAEAEVGAGRARHEALPAVAALLARPEREFDRPVRHRRRVARAVFA